MDDSFYPVPCWVDISHFMVVSDAYSTICMSRGEQHLNTQNWLGTS